MSQGERIEILKPCPLTPSSKRNLVTQGIKISPNLNLIHIAVLVAVSLTLILISCGLVIISFLASYLAAFGTEYHWLAGMFWSGMTFVGGLMILVPDDFWSD
ncbi:MAG: hypothetical protein ACFFF4_04445 [Candidatus Thorarchaeota archaeon]